MESSKIDNTPSVLPFPGGVGPAWEISLDPRAEPGDPLDALAEMLAEMVDAEEDNRMPRR